MEIAIASGAVVVTVIGMYRCCISNSTGGAIAGGAVQQLENQVRNELRLEGGTLQEWLQDDAICRRVERLVLSESRVTTVPAQISHFHQLTVLSLWGNQLRELPRAICALRNLESLWLSDNYLTALPTEIGNLSNLFNLQVRRNRLVSLPSSFTQLHSLVIFWADDNSIIQLPDGFDGLSRLARLTLANNRISVLPAQFGRLKSLSIVNLSGNRLSDIPPSIGGCVRLTDLDLRRNPLQRLPKEIAIPALLASCLNEQDRHGKFLIGSSVVLPASVHATKETIENREVELLKRIGQGIKRIGGSDLYDEKMVFQCVLKTGEIPSGYLSEKWRRQLPDLCKPLHNREIQAGH